MQKHIKDWYKDFIFNYMKYMSPAQKKRIFFTPDILICSTKSTGVTNNIKGSTFGEIYSLSGRGSVQNDKKWHISVLQGICARPFPGLQQEIDSRKLQVPTKKKSWSGPVTSWKPQSCCKSDFITFVWSQLASLHAKLIQLAGGSSYIFSM